MSEIGREGLEYLVDLGRSVADLNGLAEINGTPVSQGKMELYPELRDRPQRVVEIVYLSTARAFVEYVGQHGVAGESAVFVDENGTKAVAVIDYHGRDPANPNVPGWTGHRAVYHCPHAPEWLLWTKSNGKTFTQVEFAEFLERNARHISEGTEGLYHDSARMLEIAKSLEAKTKVDFKSGVRLDNGEVKFEFIENIEARAGQKGEIHIPSEFLLLLRVYQGDDAYFVKALLRYRIDQKGVLTFRFDLLHEAVQEDAFERLFQKIRDELSVKAPGVAIYAGSLD